MTRPAQALAQARRAAAEMRARGAYAGVDQTPAGPPRPTLQRLLEWAVVEPDLRQIRSLRRYGYPMTLLKRLLLRLLAQYHAQLLGGQARFNLLLLGYVEVLEARIKELEERLGVESGPRQVDVRTIAEDVARVVRDQQRR